MVCLALTAVGGGRITAALRLLLHAPDAGGWGVTEQAGVLLIHQLHTDEVTG